MNKKHILLFILCLLTAALLPFNATAADKVNTNEKCSFSLTFTVGRDKEKAEGIEFKMYRVADLSSTDDYSVTDRFAVYPISFDDIDDSNSWRSLAQTLSGYVVSDNLQPDSVSVTTASGRAYFSELPVGLYLVIGSQYTDSNEMVYTPQSFMVSVPSKDDNHTWQYDLSADVKYDITFDNGDDGGSKHDDYSGDYELDILKIWDDNSNPNRPHEIMVEVYCDDNLYDTIVLNKANNWKYSLKNLNEKRVWTVIEKSVADDYTVSVERQDNRFVITNTMDDNPNEDNPNGNNLTKPPHTNDSTLPQTGLLWWPVPCLLAGGLLIIIIGVVCRRGTANEG